MRPHLLVAGFSLFIGLSGCVEDGLPLLSEGAGGDQPSNLGCEDGVVACDGACTKVDDDPLHCGACGRDCFGGACDAGRCQPVVLATDELGVSALAVDDTHVYWSIDNVANNAIRRIRLDGTEEETLSTTDHAQAFKMVVHGDYLYWTRQQGEHSVLRMPKGGGAETVLWEVLDASEPSPTGIAADSDFVYWANRAQGDVLKFPLAGGAVTAVASDKQYPDDVTTGGGRVLWTIRDSEYQPGKVQAWSASGEQTLISNQTDPQSVRTDGVYFYWVVPGEGTVKRAKLVGGGLTVLASGESNPRLLMLDDDRLYWLAETSIRSIASSGGDISTVYDLGSAGEVPSVPDMAQDETSLYWAQPETGVILRLAKPL